MDSVVDIKCIVISLLARLKEDEGGVPSTVAEAHRKQLEDMDEVVRKEQQVSVGHIYPSAADAGALRGVKIGEAEALAVKFLRPLSMYPAIPALREDLDVKQAHLCHIYLLTLRSLFFARKRGKTDRYDAPRFLDLVAHLCQKVKG